MCSAWVCLSVYVLVTGVHRGGGLRGPGPPQGAFELGAEDHDATNSAYRQIPTIDFPSAKAVRNLVDVFSYHKGEQLCDVPEETKNSQGSQPFE